MFSGIYKWTSPSGKSYIGQAVNLKRRKREFERQLIYTSKGSKIDNARAKYNDFSKWHYEILEQCPIENLDEREIYWIDYFNTLNDGYNCSIGGDATKGRKMEEWQIEVCRQTMKKAWEEGRAKSFFKEHPEWASTHKYERTDEIKNKISRGLVEYFKVHKSPACKRIGQYNNQGVFLREFASLKDAAKSIGLTNTTSLSHCLRGDQKTCKGYIWKYMD